MVVTVSPPPIVYHFTLPIILPRRDRITAFYSINPLYTRLCFIRFMTTHFPPDKYKDKDSYKEEDDEDYLNLLINLVNFDICRVTEVSSLVVGK